MLGEREQILNTCCRNKKPQGWELQWTEEHVSRKRGTELLASSVWWVLFSFNPVILCLCVFTNSSVCVFMKYWNLNDLTFWCLLPTQICPFLLSCLCPAAWCLDLHIPQDLPARWVSIEFYIFQNMVMCSALSVWFLLSLCCLWKPHQNPFYLKRAI